MTIKVDKEELEQLREKARAFDRLAELDKFDFTLDYFGHGSELYTRVADSEFHAVDNITSGANLLDCVNKLMGTEI